MEVAEGAWGLAYGIAQVYAGLGERDRALEWLEREAGTGDAMLYTAIEPIFRTLHAEPRFRAILKKKSLPAIPEPSS